MDADAERIENAQGKAKDTTAKEVLTIMKFRYRCCNTTKVGEGKKLHPCMHSIARRCSSFFSLFFVASKGNSTRQGGGGGYIVPHSHTTVKKGGWGKELSSHLPHPALLLRLRCFFEYSPTALAGDVSTTGGGW